jgi:5-methylcytosine-specific restriction endonuclease McrA
MLAERERTRILANWHRNKDRYNAQRRRHRADPEIRLRLLAYDKQWRTEHPEQYRAQLQRKSKARLTLRFRIFARDGFQCRYCGRKPPEVVLQVDHIYPVSKGGRNNPDNYATACSDCNLGKSDALLDLNIASERLRG